MYFSFIFFQVLQAKYFSVDFLLSHTDATAKSPDQKFWMDCKKDKIGNFERGYSQSNHRKVTDFGLLQDFKRMIMTFGSRVKREAAVLFLPKKNVSS